MGAAFLGGKCKRCSHYYKKYGPPKTCEQCKQKSAFDKKDNSKLMCWVCLESYKRALAKTKQQDPARNSSVFREKKQKSEEEIRVDKERRKEEYMKSKMPKREDVTKLPKNEAGGVHDRSSTLVGGPSPSKMAKRDRETTETDHMGEITQLKEKIAALEKQINQKDRLLITKDQEITQMKAKLFNEERLIREKMKLMSKAHEEKVTELNVKVRSLQSEISRMKKVQNKPEKKKMDNLFRDGKKFVKMKTDSRTSSPVSRSRSRSRSPVKEGRTKENTRSRSRSPQRSGANSRADSVNENIESPAQITSTTIVASPQPQAGSNGKEIKVNGTAIASDEKEMSPQSSPVKSRSVRRSKSRSRSKDRSMSRSKSRSRSKSKSRSVSRSRSKSRSGSRSKSGSKSRSSSPANAERGDD